MIIWNYILLGVLLISALLVAYYDLKYQKIPIWLLLTNYISLSFLVDYALLLGLVVILYAMIKDVPIDVLYLIIMGYLIIIVNSKVLTGVLLIGFIAYVLLAKKVEKRVNSNKLSMMFPLEFSVTALVLIANCPNIGTIPMISLGQLI